MNREGGGASGRVLLRLWEKRHQDGEADVECQIVQGQMRPASLGEEDEDCSPSSRPSELFGFPHQKQPPAMRCWALVETEGKDKAESKNLSQFARISARLGERGSMKTNGDLEERERDRPIRPPEPEKKNDSQWSKDERTKMTHFHLQTKGSMSRETRVMVRRPDLRAWRGGRR